MDPWTRLLALIAKCSGTSLNQAADYVIGLEKEREERRIGSDSFSREVKRIRLVRRLNKRMAVAGMNLS